MKKLAVFAVAAVMAVAAFAQEAHWMGDSLMVVNGSWFNGSKSVEGWTDFNGYDFGTISSLILGGEVQTYGESACGDLPAQMNVKFDNDDATTLTGNLGWSDWTGNNNVFKNESAITVDLNQFDAYTEHTMTVYFSKDTTDTTAENYSNGKLYGAGGDISAKFTAVPEPATMSLLGIGALAMALRRKLRK